MTQLLSEAERERPTERVPLGDLKPHPRNYKKHPTEQLRHLAESLRQYGQFRNVVIAREGTILAGHGVVEAARLRGWTHVICVRLDLAPMSTKALKLLALDNELPKFGETDDRALTLLLREVARDDVDGLLGTGFEAAPSDPTSPEDFPSFDEGIETEHKCPKCGYAWSGKAS